MTEKIEIALLEQLASKICHDLISPIGAINNGVEFLEDAGASIDPEIIELISFSALQASAKLQAFRIAYGAGGADSSIKPENVHKTVQKIIGQENKITQNWDPHADLGAASMQRGFNKVLMCALMLAMEALPKGGALSVTSDGRSVSVMAEGPGAGLRPHVLEALGGTINPADLEPQDVHSAMTALMAAHYGFGISAGETGQDRFEFRISVV